MPSLLPCAQCGYLINQPILLFDLKRRLQANFERVHQLGGYATKTIIFAALRTEPCWAFSQGFAAGWVANYEPLSIQVCPNKAQARGEHFIARSDPSTCLNQHLAILHLNFVPICAQENINETCAITPLGPEPSEAVGLISSAGAVYWHTNGTGGTGCFMLLLMSCWCNRHAVLRRSYLSPRYEGAWIAAIFRECQKLLGNLQSVWAILPWKLICNHPINFFLSEAKVERAMLITIGARSKQNPYVAIHHPPVLLGLRPALFARECHLTPKLSPHDCELPKKCSGHLCQHQRAVMKNWFPIGKTANITIALKRTNIIYSRLNTVTTLASCNDAQSELYPHLLPEYACEHRLVA